jgi:hypothetical protein
MKKIYENMVPRILTDEKKQRRLHISSELLRNAEMSDVSLPVTNRGVFNTTRKHNDRACSGKHRIHLARKITHVSVAGQDHACVFLPSQGG